MDAHGIESLSFRAVRTAVDVCGHGLEIYGSEGWGFESSRPRYSFAQVLSLTTRTDLYVLAPGVGY